MDCDSLHKILLNKAVQLLAQRNHSSIELKQKLSLFYLKKYADDLTVDSHCVDDQITLVIQYCLSHHWMDDIYYIEQYIDMRSRKGYGPNRIIVELNQRGLDSALIKSVFNRKNIDWYQIGLAQVQKKFHQIDKNNFQQKVKFFQFLAYRGFRQDEINQIYSLF